MIKAVIFDLDGTLLDTLVDLKNAVNYALNTLELPEISLEETRKFIGNGTLKLVERSLKEHYNKESFNKAYPLFTNYYSDHYKDNTYPYEGIFELITKLKNDGYYLGVISNKRNEKANSLVEKHFPKMFNKIQGTYIDKPTKPDPYIVNLLLKELSLKPCECLFIGDSEVDMQTAINSGMNHMLVSYGYRTETELKEKCPNEKLVKSVFNLYDEIKKWN